MQTIATVPMFPGSASERVRAPTEQWQSSAGLGRQSPTTRVATFCSLHRFAFASQLSRRAQYRGTSISRKILLVLCLLANPASCFNPSSPAKHTPIRIPGGVVAQELPELKGPVLVLGAGWVGSRLAAHLSDAGVEVSVSNRPGWDSRPKAPYFAPVTLADLPIKRYAFDITDRETWEALPDPAALGSAVITFAPEQLEVAAAFWDAYLCHVPRVIAYSTTSVYRVDTPGQQVDESTPLCSDNPRAQVEVYLQQRGATILTISGIFGDPGGTRDVCACLKAYSRYGGGNYNGQKAVNMVHADDIIAATAHVLADGKTTGVRFNVAGKDFRLHELLSFCKHPKAAEARAHTGDTDPTSKVVLSDKLLDEVLPAGHDFVPPFEFRASQKESPERMSS